MMALADDTMPKLRNAVEILTYALFPIVVLIIVVSGQFAVTFLRAYLGSLLWVQLWPPLYAVTNFIMNTKAATGLSGATVGNGLALKYYNYLGSAVASDQAVAGVLAVAIPVIAYGIVQATMAAANSVVSSVTTGGAYGASASQGNLSMGNATLDTAKAGLHSAGQYNMAPTMRSGMPVETLVGAGVNTSTFADGTTAVDAAGMQHKMNARLNAGSRMSASLQRQSEQAETAAIGNLMSAAASTAAALQQSADFVRTHAKGERAGQRYGLGDQAGFSQAVSQTQKVIDSFAKKHGLDQSQSAELLGMAAASMHNPKALDLVSPVSVQAAAQVTGKSAATAKQLLEEARNFARETGFSEAVDKVRRASREATFDTNNDSSRRAMAGIRASLDQSQQHVDQASASHQQSLAYKEAASRTRENSGAWESGLLRQFTDWMGTQYNAYSGRNFDGVTVAQMAEKNPELLAPFVERFFKERVEPTLSTSVGEVKTAGDVQTFFERGKAGVPSAGDVGKQGGQWLADVKGAAVRVGVDPAKIVDSALPRQVAAEQGRAQKAIAAGQGNIETQGKPVEQKVRDQTAPGTQPLLGIAATNAVGQVMPDGISRVMMEKLPGVNMSVGTTGSAVAEAAAERSRKGQPRDPVLQSVKTAGGALGDAASNVKEGIVRSWRGEEPYITNTLGLGEGQGSVSPQPQGIKQRQPYPGGESGLLQRTWDAGERVVRETIGTPQPEVPQPPLASDLPQQAATEQANLLAGSSGRSNLGKVLGEQSSIPNHAPQGNEGTERRAASDAPPPGNR